MVVGSIMTHNLVLAMLLLAGSLMGMCVLAKLQKNISPLDFEIKAHEMVLLEAYKLKVVQEQSGKEKPQGSTIKA
jgi:hypothetical protein